MSDTYSKYIITTHLEDQDWVLRRSHDEQVNHWRAMAVELAKTVQHYQNTLDSQTEEHMYEDAAQVLSESEGE